MKLIKLFSVVAISAITLNAFATKTAEARIMVIAPTYTTSSSVLLTEDDAVAADFSTNNNGPLGAAPTNSWAVQAWLQNGETKYAGVENKSISNLKFCFKANANETAYKITFSQVTGTIVLKSADTTYTVIEGDTLDVTCTAGATYEFTVNPTVEYNYTHSIATGKWGTICFEEAISTVAGCDVYEFSGKDAGKVYAKLVDARPLTAGKAYLINATADAQGFSYTDATKATQPGDNNGLVGKFAQYTTVEAGAYVVKGNSLMPAAVGSTVPANRAFVPELNDIQGGAPAPGAPGRFVSFTIGAATDLEALEVAPAMNGKMILNGRMVIVKDGKMFNAQGAAL